MKETYDDAADEVREGQAMKTRGSSSLSSGRGMGLGNYFPLFYQELYMRYCMEFSEDSFERFYRATSSFFLSFAAEKCAAAGHDLDPNDVVNRLYGILVSHASGRRRGVPFKALFSWCFGTITNIVKEETRHRNRPLLRLSSMKKDPEDQRSPLVKMIQKEESEYRNNLYNNVLGLISSDNTTLSHRERRVMSMFYCESKPLRSIAVKLGIKVEHAAVILFRSRRRLSQYFNSRSKQA